MITEILEGLIKILDPIATLSKDRRELKDSALRAISNTLDETFCIIETWGKEALEIEILIENHYWLNIGLRQRFQ